MSSFLKPTTKCHLICRSMPVQIGVAHYHQDLCHAWYFTDWSGLQLSILVDSQQMYRFESHSQNWVCEFKILASLQQTYCTYFPYVPVHIPTFTIWLQMRLHKQRAILINRNVKINEEITSKLNYNNYEKVICEAAKCHQIYKIFFPILKDDSTYQCLIPSNQFNLLYRHLT